MSLTALLFHPALQLALLAYGVLSIALVWAEFRLSGWLHHHPVTGWLSEHVYLPLARAALILAFIAMAYPVLYGVTGTPPLPALLAGGEHRLSHLINLLFLLSLLLPLLPVIGALPGLILPAQGITAAGLLFYWLIGATGQAADLFPGWPAAGMILLWIYAGHRLALAAADRLGAWGNTRFEMEDLEKAAYEFLILICQTPAILIYTLALGRQLNAG